MRELEVLGDGHLKLAPGACKEFFEEEMAEQVRSQLKALIEQALEAERDRYLDLGYYEHAPQFRCDYRNGYYFRDLATRLGLLRGLRMPRTRRGFRSQLLPRYQRRQQAVPASEGAAEPLHHVDDAPVRGGTETILIAEDHEGMREMAQEILEALGYRLLLAHDGEEAVSQFLAHRDIISLVLLDVVMPKLDGTDAYERMCQAKIGVPVIFTSGYSDQGALLTAIAAKGATILQKPYSSKVLARKVRELLDEAQVLEPTHLQS